MAAPAQALIDELDAEAPATRRVLERLPADRFDWQPHPKSLTVAQLAQHVATIPGSVARFLALDGFDLSTRKIVYPAAESLATLLATFDESVHAARDFLGSLDADRAN